MNLNSELSWVDPKNDPNNRSLLFAKKIFHRQKQNHSFNDALSQEQRSAHQESEKRPLILI